MQTDSANEQERRKQQATFWLEYSQQLWGAIRYHEALEAAERALTLDGANPQAWHVKGACLCLLAQHQSALEAFEQALQLDQEYAPAWDGKAWALGIMGRRAEALAAVDEALRLDPDYFEAQRRKKRFLVP